MSAQWLTNTSDLPGRVRTALEQGLHSLSQPRSKRVIHRSLLVIFALWALYAAASLVWALLPQPEPAAAPLADLVNPASGTRPQSARATIDIQQLSGWQRCVTAGAEAEATAGEDAGRVSSS